MNDILIIKNTNDQDNLMREIKIMSFVKFINLLCCVIRFFLMFFLLFLIAYFPASFKPTLTNLIFIIYLLLILPIITIFLLVVVLSGTIKRDFWIKTQPLKFGCYTLFCGCCIMSKNVNFLKNFVLTNTCINFIWSFYFLYYLIKDYAFPHNFTFFPFSEERVIIRAILNFLDSTLLACQYCCFFYTKFFLKKTRIYLEFYKRLIIKNKNKEAEFVRDNLPDKVEDYLSSNEGTELQNI